MLTRQSYLPMWMEGRGRGKRESKPNYKNDIPYLCHILLVRSKSQVLPTLKGRGLHVPLSHPKVHLPHLWGELSIRSSCRGQSYMSEESFSWQATFHSKAHSVPQKCLCLVLTLLRDKMRNILVFSEM